MTLPPSKPRLLGAPPGRRKGPPPYCMLVHAYFQSPQYAALSTRAVKLLIDVYCQYRGRNNGDLCATWKVMRPMGWTSKSQLEKALAELEARGWLLKTRQGDLTKASLYAVTFLSIDDCSGKLDPSIKAGPALHLWKRSEYAAPPKASGRQVRKLHRPDLHTGHARPSTRGTSPNSGVVVPLHTGRG